MATAKIIGFNLQFVEDFKYRAIVSADSTRAASLRILDKNMRDSLRGEFRGILTWAIKGAMLWWNKGKPDLREPKMVTDAVEEYRSDSDRLGQFIDERCERVATVTTPLSHIYLNYKSWVLEKGGVPWGDRTLSANLKNAGFKMSRSMTGIQCKGLRLRPSAAKKTEDDLKEKARKKDPLRSKTRR